MTRIALASTLTAALVAASMAFAGEVKPPPLKPDPRAAPPALGVKTQRTLEADCDVVVPAGALVVKGQEVLTTSEVNALVCPGAQVTATAKNATLYIVGEADVSVAGDGATIYHRGSGRLAVAGNNATVYSERLSITVLSGQGSTLLKCPRVNIDTSAVAGGC